MTAVLMLGALLLETLQGNPFTLDHYDQREATVLVYLSSRCPATEEAIDRINTLYERHRHSGALLIGLIGNQEETAEEVQHFAQALGVRFPIYRDPARQVAQQLGVTATLQACLADSTGKVLYQGAFADNDAAKAFGKALGNHLRGRALPEAKPASGATPLDQPGAPRTLEDRYPQPFFKAQLVFDSLEGVPAHHCSTLAECPNGDLLCVWYGGSYESADDQRLFLARKVDGAAHWNTPAILVDSHFPTPPGNAVVFRLGQRIGLIWGRMEAARPLARGTGWESCRLLLRWSEDNAQTWGDDTELTGLQGCLPRNAPFTLADGRFAVPLSGHGGDLGGAFLLMTADQGKTWTPSGVMKAGSQPTVIQRESGHLLALLRHQPKILQALSTDDAVTWTTPEETDLPCPEAAIAMTRLNNGHLLLVYDNSLIARTPLAIARSIDEGRTWQKPPRPRNQSGRILLSLRHPKQRRPYPHFLHLAPLRHHARRSQRSLV